MHLKSFFVALFAFFATPLFSQENVNLDKIVEKIISGENTYTETELFIKGDDSIDRLWQIETQLNASQSQVRYLMYNLLFRIGTQSNKEEVRYRSVYLLIDKGLADADASLSGRCIEYLSGFNNNDFDNPSRNRLASMLISAKTHVSELIHLAGQIKLTSLIPVFEQKLSTTQNKKEVWVIRCSLARMGDTEQQNYCLNRIQTMGLNDQVIQYLIPDLIFTENRAAIDYLLDLILSDHMDCSSFDPDRSEKVNCAYRLMELVAPYIGDFPVQVKASGDLDVVNYNEALATVRQWITANKSIYLLKF